MQRETWLFHTLAEYCNISILSLYAEGDGKQYGIAKGGCAISILSLYAEGDIFPLFFNAC